ncbi:conserved hypothetical protein [Vibrio coralliirubri]|nr:conserved hypothetical protein [Vibrio coralliirubri]
MFQKLNSLLDVIESVLAIIDFLVAEDFQLPTAVIALITKLSF